MPDQQKELVETVEFEHTFSIGRGCKIVGVYRSKLYYKSSKDDGSVEVKLDWLVEHFTTNGCFDNYSRLRKKGFQWNHKRVKRVYNKLQLNIR